MQGDSGALKSATSATAEKGVTAFKWSEAAVVMEDAALALASMRPSAGLAAALASRLGAVDAGSTTGEWEALNLIFAVRRLIIPYLTCARVASNSSLLQERLLWGELR